MDARGPPARLVERALNAALRLDPEWAECLAPLVGSTFLVEVEPSGAAVAAHVAADGIHLVEPDAPADVTVRGPLPALFEALRDGALPNGLHVSGDLGILQLARRQLARIDLDLEELLARLLGDVAGRQGARLLRAGAAYGAQAGSAIARDVAEYLTEEAGLVAASWPVERFCEEVDRLRDGVERLAARIERLGGGR